MKVVIHLLKMDSFFFLSSTKTKYDLNWRQPPDFMSSFKKKKLLFSITFLTSSSQPDSRLMTGDS